MTDPREIPGLDRVLGEDVYEHCFSATNREVGGVLVGSMMPGNPPQVTGSIRAIQADETAAQLTFTQEAWEHIHQVLETRFPDGKIVGWYHTHPRYGLFLSEQDMFIHRNFFQNRSQIALVIDPLAGEEAVFVWRGKEVVEYFRRSTGHEPLGEVVGERPPQPVTQSVAPPPSIAAAPQGARLPRVDLSRPVPAAHWIYMAVIALSAGTIVWELFLK